jgi:hypothetical protein
MTAATLAATKTKLGASPSEVDDGQPTREVCRAVALGWQVAELYHDVHDRPAEPAPAAGGAVASMAEEPATDLGDPPPDPGAGDLPGVGKLSHDEKRELRMAQLAHGLSFLASATEDDELERLHGEVYEALEKARIPGDLRRLHVELLRALTVADFRLGKAYSLGRALRETSAEMQSTDGLEYHLGEKHLTKLIAWCADLKSVLPDHAGQAVAGSLRRWQSWGRQRPWTAPIGRADFDHRLNRQGERWRAILTGEKNARDVLTVGAYIDAGEELLSDASGLAVGFAKRFWLPSLFALVLVLGGITAILLGGNGVIGGLASILAGLGISWKTATPILSQIGEKLSTPLWEAELDTAIAVAVTDPMVPSTSAAPPSADQPVPVKRAIDPRTTRKTARQIWKRLDRASRTRALTGRDPLKRLGYRLSGLWRGGAKEPFMPHDAYLSHVQSALEARLASKDLESGTSSRDELFAQFGPDDLEWIKTVVQSGLTMLDGKHDFGVKPVEQEMAEHARIVLFGDWATATPRAQALAGQIERELVAVGPDVELHVIHLGDVYYCGEPDEYQSRFLRHWPARGECARATSWNLNGNHDMYSGGHGYFELIDPQREAAAIEPGVGDLAPDAFKQQDGTSFFRIFNDDWQIIGLDSAYVDNDLDERQEPWLKQWIGLAPDDEHPPPSGRRKTILLSHHQLGSARAQASVGPGIREKTAEIRKDGRIQAWFWGHEHRALVYEPYLGVRFPVCLGNGGVPELLSHVFTFAGAFQACVDFVRRIGAWLTPRRRAAHAPKVKFTPQAPRVDRQGLKWEKLGFVVIDLKGSDARAIYYAEDEERYEIELFGS